MLSTIRLCPVQGVSPDMVQNQPVGPVSQTRCFWKKLEFQLVLNHPRGLCRVEIGFILGSIINTTSADTVSAFPAPVEALASQGPSLDTVFHCPEVSSPGLPCGCSVGTTGLWMPEGAGLESGKGHCPSSARGLHRRPVGAWGPRGVALPVNLWPL